MNEDQLQRLLWMLEALRLEIRAATVKQMGQTVEYDRRSQETMSKADNATKRGLANN